jgi:hypothetical protein
MMQELKERAVVKPDTPTAEVGLDYKGDIIVGEFVERQEKTLMENYEDQMRRVMGDAFVPYKGAEAK